MPVAALSLVVLLASALLRHATCDHVSCLSNDIQQTLLPCACLHRSSEVVLQCSNLTHQDALDGALERPSQDFDALVLSDCDLRHVSAWSLRDRSFRAIRVSRSRLTGVFDEAPGLYNSLEEFRLHRVEAAIDWNQFRNLQKIRELVLEEVSVPELGEEFRRSFSKRAERVVLRGTNTSRLAEGVFARCSRLSMLAVQGARVSALKRSMFASPSTIRMFLFDNNRLENIPEDLFTDMPRLTRIGLGFNNISHIPERTFGGVFNHLEALVLEGNPIVCDCSIQWITERSTRGKYVTGACALPENLAGRELLDLVKEDFAYCTT